MLIVSFIFFMLPVLPHYLVHGQITTDSDSQTAVAYKLRSTGEEIVENVQSRAPGQINEAVPEAIVLTCNPVESGSPLPFPTTAISLRGHFYVYQSVAEWLPPDSGLAGKATIIGIDSDGDCVRDDIERFIAHLMPGGDQIKARKYMFEYAKWRGQFLKSAYLSTQTAQEISRNLYKSAECVRRIIGNDPQSQEIIDKVFAKFHNTFPRSYRYIANNAVLGGWSTREKISVSCP